MTVVPPWLAPRSSVLAAAFAFSFFFLWRRRKARKAEAIRPAEDFSVDKQSIEIEGKPGVYKCAYIEGDRETLDLIYPDVKTLYDAFLRGVRVSGKRPCLGERKSADAPYTFLTYEEVAKHAVEFSSALVGELGCEPGNDTRIGIYSRNCSEWMLTTLGAIHQSMVVVPLYDTLGADAAGYVISQCDLGVIVTDTASKADSLLSNKSKLPSLRHIVIIEENGLTTELKEKAKEVGVSLHTFSAALAYGRASPAPIRPPSPDDIYIICYTSGTTGLPKGVMLTHSNVVHNIGATVYTFSRFKGLRGVGPEDSAISYLPLSHMFEQMIHWAVLVQGASVGYFRGNIKGLLEDAQALKPTVFVVVPRLLNRLYDSVQAKLATTGFVGRTLFNVAYNAKLADLKRGIIRNDTIWDRLVFGKIQAQLGSRVRLMVTGSAPISGEVLTTCRVVLGAVLCEGYGQTECTAVATGSWPGDASVGHVGGPASCATLRLDDVPELNYFAKDGKGEVCVKGPSVTKGYFKDPEKTAELFTENGFLRTGDIGHLLPNGALKIIDRKKHIFKLAQGEYVAPEKIENVYARCPFVQQIYVDGNSMERWLIAVVVPDAGVLKNWDEHQNGHSNRSLEEICRDEKAAAQILSELQAVGKQNKLNSIEQVKKLILEPTPFTVENGLLTPTLKAKRPLLRTKYAEGMAVIYRANPTL